MLLCRRQPSRRCLLPVLTANAAAAAGEDEVLWKQLWDVQASPSATHQSMCWAASASMGGMSRTYAAATDQGSALMAENGAEGGARPLSPS